MLLLLTLQTAIWLDIQELYQQQLKLSVVDECVGEVYNKVLELGGTMLITADHGNSEMLLDEDNNPFTAHTTNEVPLIVTNSHLELKEGGKLGDLAPTILQLLGLEIPAEMDGESLLK